MSQFVPPLSKIRQYEIVPDKSQLISCQVPSIDFCALAAAPIQSAGKFTVASTVLAPSDAAQSTGFVPAKIRRIGLVPSTVSIVSKRAFLKRMDMLRANFTS
jgi:hypothetical protein